MKNHPKLAPGDVLAGRYRLDALIGEGGFGAVYRATQLPIGRSVALKVLLDEMLMQSDGRARFRQEAELAQRLESPNTVRLYDFGETEEGVPFIAWELLKGRPLDGVLEAEGRLAAPRAAHVAVQILKALMEAHALGIVHRDLKPPNVFLCSFPGESDFVKVLDFGLAKSTLTRAATRMTPEGSILGTPAYMSPEQVKGGAVGPPSDLFSLGLMMAELVTGARVFPGSSPWDIIAAQIEERPTPLSPEVLASPLGPVIARATERSLERRYRTAAEMLQDVEAAVAGAGSVRFHPPSAATAPASASLAASLPASSAAYAVTAPSTAYGAPASSAAYGAPAPSVARAAPAPLSATHAAPAPSVAYAAPAPSVAYAAPPPSSVAYAAPAPAGRGSRGKVVVAAVAGAFVAAGMLLGALYAAGVFDGPARAAASATAASPATGGRPFAGLDNKQIRARIIEGARYKILMTDDKDAATTWMLAGMNGCYVQVTRLPDLKAAESLERILVKQQGATARDGTSVLHVHLPQAAEAKALLAQITR